MCWILQRGPHVDARVEQLLDVLPAFGMAAVRGIGMGKFVDDDQLGPARQRGVDVELFDLLAAIVDRPARQDFETSSSAAVSARHATRQGRHDVDAFALQRRARADIA